jgi:hypothetical protein
MNLELVYKKICERGQIRILDKSIYTEKHHIVPRCMGGHNKKTNLTKLTAKEHFICHKILCKIYPDNEKLRYAFWAMCNQKNNRDYLVSSRNYEYAKSLCLEMWRRPKSPESIKRGADKRRGKKIDYNLHPNRIQNGELNHNYGRIWITNILTNESKMIIGDIPEGWKIGRVKIGSLGKSNSIGKSWYHKDNQEKYFRLDEVSEGWTKGRLKNNKIGGDNLSGKICYYNNILNKERYFSNSDIIPDGWKKGKLSKRSWFYNTELNIEKLLTENEIKNGWIKGRLPKLPFQEIKEDDNISIRIFNNETKPEFFVWHRDREDRIIESIGETDWMIQLDDELPKIIEGEVFIPMGVYHRVIKGTGDLKIKLIKNPII